jgi:hypothetical protein
MKNAESGKKNTECRMQNEEWEGWLIHSPLARLEMVTRIETSSFAS